MAFPADGGTDGLGRSLSVDSSGEGIRHHPAEKTPLRAAQRVEFLGSTAKMGAQARFRPDPAKRGELPAGAGRGMPSRVAGSRIA